LRFTAATKELGLEEVSQELNLMILFSTLIVFFPGWLRI
jgi:hypothetical protein